MQTIRLGNGPAEVVLTEEMFATVVRIAEATDNDVRVQVEGGMFYVYVGTPNSETLRYWVYQDGEVMLIERAVSRKDGGLGTVWERWYGGLEADKSAPTVVKAEDVYRLAKDTLPTTNTH